MAFTKPRLILTQGLISARPDASTVAVGTLYYATDTLAISRSNGTTWDAWTIAQTLTAQPELFLDLFAYLLCRIAFLEQALGVEPNQEILVPEALTLVDTELCPWPFY